MSCGVLRCLAVITLTQKSNSLKQEVNGNVEGLATTSSNIEVIYVLVNSENSILKMF